MTKKPVKKPSKKAALKPVAAPVQTGSVVERAMLVTLRQSIWRANRTDDEVTAEVAKKHGNRADMGTYKKFLVDPSALQGGYDILRKAKAIHCRYTLPWMDGGQRILSGAAYFDYTREMNKLLQEYNEWVDNTFIPKYPDHKKAAKEALNGLYKEEDYPTSVTIRSKFGMEIIPDLISNPSDFRVKLGNDTVDHLKKELSVSVEKRLQDAIKDVWSRLQEVVSHMVQRLNKYEVEEVSQNGKCKAKVKVKHTFRDTLVTNITELLEVVPLLNITNDPNLAEFCTTIREQLTGVAPEVLRDDEKQRKQVAQKAEDILKKIGAFL